MGGLFRSKDMAYVQLTMATEVAHDTIKELGKLGKYHIVDIAQHEVPSKQYIAYKKRANDCSFWEKKLTTFEDQMANYNIKLPFLDPVEVSYGDVLEELKEFLEPIEKEIVLSVSFQTENQRQISEAKEYLHVLSACKDLEIVVNVAKADDHDHNNTPSQEEGKDLSAPLLIELKEGKMRIGIDDDSREGDSFRKFICGVIPVSKQILFQRMLYRISRGNAFVNFAQIDDPTMLDPATGEVIEKAVFYVVCIGQQLHRRIRKMGSIFSATEYPLPTSPTQYAAKLRELNDDIREKTDVAQRTTQQVTGRLMQLANHNNSCPLRDWQRSVRREMMICETFMKAHFLTNNMTLEGWCPRESLQDLAIALKSAVRDPSTPSASMDVDVQNPIKEPASPPTYFPLNTFTASFQVIVDTYGVPRYHEVNPGLFTIVTFPFLFGVMYGDIGHGSCLTLFAIYLLWNESKLLIQQRNKQMDEIFSMIFDGRYVLILMGLFGLYCGTIYNDCMSKPVNAFGSTWSWHNDTETYESNGETYPYGVDPYWYGKSNQLTFFNSLKMKMSVTLGVIHMTFGVFLSLANHIYFKDYVSVVFEFIPRLLFLQCTFGYMIFLIIYKWCVDWSTHTMEPPNLIQSMINMFLSPGTLKPEDEMYTGQGNVELAFLIIALVAIPVMLFPKPFINRWRHNKAARAHMYHRTSPQHEDEEKGFVTGVDEEKKEDLHQVVPPAHAPAAAAGGGHGGHDGPYSFSDDFIHQGIHTIEYVLGTISNTASYLRLWALSLAHAELADVFWDKMIIEYGLNMGAPGAIWGFAGWAAATFGVLLAMDVLECFLHALRLHWVEFQNKFYSADGYAFIPFSFTKLDN